MKNKIKTLSYTDLLAEREQIRQRYNKTVSNIGRRDLSKYLKRLDQEIGERRKNAREQAI